MSDHLKENTILIKRLKSLIEKHPEQRFSQILLNYNFVLQSTSEKEDRFWKDEFYLEPKILIQRTSLDQK